MQMATASLQSFITAHERKFQAKLDAMAREQQPEAYSQAIARSFPEASTAYRSALRRRFVTHDKVPYLHYEMIPRT